MLTYSFEARGKKSIYECLYRNIKEDILEGRLETGEKLPSKRTLARHLEVSVITVENAYAQLMVEGYVYSVEKKGYFVSDVEEQRLRTDKAEEKRRRIDAVGQPIENPCVVDFSANSPAADNFPFSIWSRIMRRVLSEKQTELLKRVHYQGILELRRAISEHLYHFRGMDVMPEQIIVGAGTEYLYGLLIQLLGREKVYAVEEPGHQKIGKIYEKNGVDCAYIPLDREGLSVKDLRESTAQVVHITPAHHYPTGRIMPIRRRQELLRWAEEGEGRYVIEDDYDSEFRFTGRPIQTLQSIDRQEGVIYMNTFSKTICPSIRISYMVLPPHLLNRYRQELNFYSCTVASFEQYTLAEFMLKGYLEQHINRMRNYYRGLRDELISGIRSSGFAQNVEILEEDAGLHFLLKVRTEQQAGELRKKVEGAGIRVSWLEEYYHHNCCDKENVAVINYSGISSRQIDEAVNILEKVFCT